MSGSYRGHCIHLALLRPRPCDPKTKRVVFGGYAPIDPISPLSLRREDGAADEGRPIVAAITTAEA
jgi:hypothetical protein